MYYSLYLPQRGNPDLYGKTILAADIGGTKTSLGLFEVGRDTLSLLHEATVPSKGDVTFEGIVTKFLDSDPAAVISHAAMRELDATCTRPWNCL